MLKNMRCDCIFSVPKNVTWKASRAKEIVLPFQLFAYLVPIILNPCVLLPGERRRAYLTVGNRAGSTLGLHPDPS